MRGILICVVCAYLCFEATGQTVLENNPTHLRWNQVNTEHFRVLFPVGFENQAQRVASTLEYLHAPEARTMGATPRRISVILQNQSAQSNGFVSLVPRRSEFYTMPSQDYNFIGTNDWLDLLSSHEYRHVVQYRHANRGINRLIYILFGSTTLVGVSHAAAPQWFWEGDAVATETAFTPSGRGRIPHFGLVFRTNLLEGRTFNYHKQYLRSYKHNIPDHYVLGYHMVSYLRQKTQDPEIWGKVTARAWNASIIPFTFSNALHHETGSHVTRLYNDMAASLKQQWQSEIDKLALTPFENLYTRTSGAYTDYLYPQVMEDGSLIAMKKGIGDIEKFMRFRDGEWTRYFTPGFVNDAGMLSAEAGKIVWTEYGYDPRWRVKSFSRIKIFETTTGKHRTIGNKKDRLAGAALSPDGSRIVVVRSANDYANELLVINVETGKELFKNASAENVMYSMPRWSLDGKSIVALKTGKEGRTIVRMDGEAKSSRDLFPMTQENIGHPVLVDNHLFFNSPVSGIDNVYMLDLESGKRYQVTCSKYGAYNPSVSKDKKWLYYNEQTRDGLDVVRIPFEPSVWKAYSKGTTSVTQDLANNLVEQEATAGFWNTIPRNNLPVRHYSKLSGIINPYGWGAYLTNDLTQINVGVSSRDILSTTSLSAGFLYDINEKTSAWNASVSYQALYPIVDLAVQSGDRNDNKEAFGHDIHFDWKELTTEAGLRIPLLLTNSKYSRSLTFGDAAGFTHTTSFVNTVTKNGEEVYRGPERITPAYDTLFYIYKDQLNNGDLLYNKATLSFFNLLKRSQRDFLYRWGQSLDVEFYNTPFGGDFDAKLFAARSTLYFPGLGKHHFFYTRFAYQESMQGIETNIYEFRNRIPKPRGHSYPDDARFAAASVNYAMPLWYPDIALGPVLNIQRIKANFFYDVGKGTGNVYYYNPTSGFVYLTSSDELYQSVGLETTFDFNIFRLLPKLELGVRSTYRFANAYNTSGLVFEFIVGNIGF